jgi:hypothetical protein
MASRHQVRHHRPRRGRRRGRRRRRGHRDRGTPPARPDLRRRARWTRSTRRPTRPRSPSHAPAGAATGRPRRARPRRASASPTAAAPGADRRYRRVALGRRTADLCDLVETVSDPDHHQRHGPRHPGRRPRARGLPGADARPWVTPTSSSSIGYPAGLPPRVRVSSPRGPRWSTSWTPPSSSPPTPRAGRAGVAGHLPTVLAELASTAGGPTGRSRGCPRRPGGNASPTPSGPDGEEQEPRCCASDAGPVHPARVYGELRRVLDRDAVVIGDGGRLRVLRRQVRGRVHAGLLARPGPLRLPRHGHGVRDGGTDWPTRTVRWWRCSVTARPASACWTWRPWCAIRLPVVMIVGNNGIWALEKYPMQQLYDGWDVGRRPPARVALRPGRHRRWAAAGETVTRPGQIAPALRRALDVRRALPR